MNITNPLVSWHRKRFHISISDIKPWLVPKKNLVYIKVWLFNVDNTCQLIVGILKKMLHLFHAINNQFSLLSPAWNTIPHTLWFIKLTSIFSSSNSWFWPTLSWLIKFGKILKLRINLQINLPDWNYFQEKKQGSKQSSNGKSIFWLENINGPMIEKSFQGYFNLFN